MSGNQTASIKSAILGRRSSHLPVVVVRQEADTFMVQSYDAPTIAVLRRALDEVVADQRFIRQGTTSALEIAELLLARAAAGERDPDRLKEIAFARLGAARRKDRASRPS
jgi:hypothetical protein